MDRQLLRSSAPPLLQTRRVCDGFAVAVDGVLAGTIRKTLLGKTGTEQAVHHEAHALDVTDRGLFAPEWLEAGRLRYKQRATVFTVVQRLSNVSPPCG